MKLTKEQAAHHAKAEEILQQATLSYEEKVFVLENWHEGATHISSPVGAFFTPFRLAEDMALEIHKNHVIDLCAGIGMLSFIACHYKQVQHITCLEINPDYIRVGKKILPEATWIQGSVLDQELIKSLGVVDLALSNPPFGAIKAPVSPDWLCYKGANFEYKVVEVASHVAKEGLFILPQNSTPFRYSGQRIYSTMSCRKLEAFVEATGIEFEFNCGIDTSVCQREWRGVSPVCEIVACNFIELQAKRTLAASKQNKLGTVQWRLTA